MPQAISIPLKTPAVGLLAQAGILPRGGQVPDHLKLYVEQADRVLEKVRRLVAEDKAPSHCGAEFQQLLIDAAARVLCHPIVASNNYLARFAQGVTQAQARHECQQFSIFAINFDVAQAKLVANAPTPEVYEERLHVLLNEKGVPYEKGFEGELSGRWTNETVHFHWLRNMGHGLGLKFEEIGKIWLATPGTRAFVNATFDNYGSADLNTASGAAFAVENWAANGLWKPWIAGMRKLNAQRERAVNIGYLTYHDAEEEHHSQATLDELLENFVEPWFDAERFFAGAEAMLTDGVQAYYASQLETLPDRDETWPQTAFEPRTFEPKLLPRLAPAPASA